MSEELDPELRGLLGDVLRGMKQDKTEPRAADFARFMLSQSEKDDRSPTTAADSRPMQCDICSAPGRGSIVRAGDMSDAVRRGFNPFTARRRRHRCLGCGHPQQECPGVTAEASQKDPSPQNPSVRREVGTC